MPYRIFPSWAHRLLNVASAYGIDTFFKGIDFGTQDFIVEMVSTLTILWVFWIPKEVMQQCYSLNAEKTKIRDRIKNAECLIMRIIWGLNIGVVSAERIKIGDIMQIGEVGSITNCLTTGKLP